MKPKSLEIIPERVGSKGIQKNNLKLLAGKPLIAYTIEATLTLKIDKVVVSMGDEEMDERSKKYENDQKQKSKYLYMLNSYNWRCKNGHKH